MAWLDRLLLFSPIDLAAVGVLLVLWLGLSQLIEHSPRRLPSTSRLMAGYRREWMRQFVIRDPRIFDSQIIGNLRQGTAFFASACMIALGGGFALLGNAERLQGVAAELVQAEHPVVVWEMKLLLLLLFAANAFLKFVWAHRLFGYCAVLMAAVPVDPTDPHALPRADKAGEINVFAARSYNRGLRSIYFGIASAAWLLGPWPLIVATVFTALVIVRREFASRSREILLGQSDGAHGDVTPG
ncbi:DUF599 domain-containing protein [Aestuariicoccus sp. MJ-SS9]|uniref:DUF599 domain-containing protein n=1 Tax=Aestuariicoccus sp. MJ-SS9 TaxID=3079855 RepID=UPI0029104B29|nr:DUF599 domain-containing protein [Aestuariicoccus sp. MJ-SS9]MDU8909994.1 DUF599 domain-containing protein [Aestuariicoccus sp. MJ-SS9]